MANKETNKQNLAPAYFVCVCGLCGCGISFSGASNISALVNYMYIISTALICTGGTQSGSLEKTLLAIAPSGSRPISRGISSYPIKDGKIAWGIFISTAESSAPAWLSSNVEYTEA